MWTNKQHIMSRLAREHRVIHVDFGGRSIFDYLQHRAGASHAGPLRRLSYLTDGVEHRGGDLYVASSWRLNSPRFVQRLEAVNDFWEFGAKVWMLKRFLHREHIRDAIVWVYHPGYAEALRQIPRKLLVYDCVDEYSAFPAYRDKEWIKSRERALCREADLVFTTSKTLYEVKAPFNPGNTHLVHNVGDAEHFKAAMDPKAEVPEEIRRLPKPVLGFVGAVSDYKLNVEWILHAAKARPEWSFAIIGPVGIGDPSTDTAALERQPNVHLLGQRAYEELPRYIKGFDAALIPYRINRYTESVFPIKFFEFMASGKPVVISNLPSLSDYYGSVLVADTADAFLLRCEEALSMGDAGREARVALAEQNSWPKRIGEMMRLIEQKLAEKR